MRKFRILFLLTILLTGCRTGQKQAENTSHAIATPDKTMSDGRLRDSLSFELCQIYGLDQSLRPQGPGTINWDAIHYADTIAFNKIVSFVKANGFPRESLLGEQNFSHECVAMAAVVVLLHNPHRLVNEKEYLNLFTEEVKRGNLKGESLATILDKYYWSKKGNKHRVLYGSQFGMPCLDIKKETNAAREKIGLEPLADSLFVRCD